MVVMIKTKHYRMPLDLRCCQVCSERTEGRQIWMDCSVCHGKKHRDL